MTEKKQVEASLINRRLGEILAEVQAVGKEGRNSSQGFNYRKIDDVVDMLHPILAKHKVFILSEIEDERTEERTTSRGGNLIYRILKVRITYVSAEDGSSQSVSVVGEGMDSGDKAANKAMTAALKYAFSQTFVLPYAAMIDGDSHSQEASKPKETAEPKTEKKSSTSDFQQKLVEQMSKDNISNADLLKYCKSKGWLADDVSVKDLLGSLPDDLIKAMLKPENWEKVKDACDNLPMGETKSNRTPVKSDGMAFNAGLYDHMKEADIAEDQLKEYLQSKGYITEKQSIHNLPEQLVTSMLKKDNWQKIVTAIKGE